VKKCLIVNKPNNNINVNSTNQLLELKQLLGVIEYDVVDVVTHNTKSPTKYYIGSGKLEEIKIFIDANEIDSLVFLDSLTILQFVNLSDYLGIEILDPTYVVLLIYLKRAKTNESKLSIELNLLKYLLPRLKGEGSEMSNQGGGIGAKGSGETKLELDRRKIREEISRKEKEVKEIQNKIINSSNSRFNTSIKTVCLVGYTNVGKSSLFNNLSKMYSNNVNLSEELNMLFTTMDTKKVIIQKHNFPAFLLIDTVGFPSFVDEKIISALFSTVFELSKADIIVFVSNFNVSSNFEELIKTIIKNNYNSETQKIIYVNTFSDVDKVFRNNERIYISNKTGEGIESLIAYIYKELFDFKEFKIIEIPLDDKKQLNYIKKTSFVHSIVYEADKIILKVFTK
jgi:GTP-binding protein HflX